MNWIEFRNFESSEIATMRYASDKSILEVSFQKGGIYHYYGVPERVWEALKAAESKGKYLNKYIKGNYRYDKVG